MQFGALLHANTGGRLSGPSGGGREKFVARKCSVGTPEVTNKCIISHITYNQSFPIQSLRRKKGLVAFQK